MHGNDEYAGKLRGAGAPAERFFGGDARDVGIVVVLGKMREDEKARAGVETFRIGEKFADGVIGKMTGAAEDALLDHPRIWADLEHVEIVIGFEDEAVGVAEMNFDEFGHVAEVGDDGELSTVGAEGECDRVSGVMRNSEGVDIDIADGECRPGLEQFELRGELAPGFGRQDGGRGEARDVDGNVQLAGDGAQTGDVIGMLVGNEDGCK